MPPPMRPPPMMNLDVDALIEAVEKIASDGSENEVKLLWKDVVTQYAKDGEVSYGVYTNLASIYMNQGRYENRNGILPFWIYFSAVSILPNANCVALQQRFTHQILSTAFEISCREFVTNSDEYVTNVDKNHGLFNLNRFQLGTLQRRLIDTSATYLVLQQELFVLWQSKINDWIRAIDRASTNPSSSSDRPQFPQWFEVSYNKLKAVRYPPEDYSLDADASVEISPFSSIVVHHEGGIPYPYNSGRFSVLMQYATPLWRVDFNYWSGFSNDELKRKENVYFENLYYDQDEEDDEEDEEILTDMKMVPPFWLQYDSNIGKAIDYRLDVYHYYNRLRDANACKLEPLGVREMGQDISNLNLEHQQIVRDMGRSAHRNAIGACTHSSYDTVRGSRNDTLFDNLDKFWREECAGSDTKIPSKYHPVVPADKKMNDNVTS